MLNQDRRWEFHFYLHLTIISHVNIEQPTIHAGMWLLFPSGHCRLFKRSSRFFPLCSGQKKWGAAKREESTTKYTELVCQYSSVHLDLKLLWLCTSGWYFICWKLTGTLQNWTFLVRFLTNENKRTGWRAENDAQEQEFVLEVWKGAHWWWDNSDLLTQHLSALPSPIQTHKPSSTHCEWPFYHSAPLTQRLSLLPATLIHSHNWSAALALRGECKHNDRCRGH